MKFYLVIIITITLSFQTYSQSSFGIKAGLNLSKAVYLNEYNNELIKPVRKLKPGFVVGFIIQQQLNKVISVQAEVLYSQKGLKTEQEYLSKYINSMNYIEVPLSGHYSIIRNKHSNLNLYIGGYGAYWTDGKYKRIDLINSEQTETKIDFNNTDFVYNRLNVGILAGCSFQKNNVSYFLRYTHSMIGSSQKNADALSNHITSLGINYFIIH